MAADPPLTGDCHVPGPKHQGKVGDHLRRWYQKEKVAESSQAYILNAMQGKAEKLSSLVIWTTINSQERLDGYQGRLVTLERQLAARNRLVTGKGVVTLATAFMRGHQPAIERHREQHPLGRRGSTGWTKWEQTRTNQQL